VVKTRGMIDYDIDSPASFGEFLGRLFKPDFMPHGHCYFWRHDLLTLHIVSDLLIVLAYYSIPLALFWFVRKKKELPFNWLFIMFGAFIFLCGTTHLMNVFTLFNGVYRAEGLLKLTTGLVSCVTAVMTVRLIPKALELKSPEEMLALNKVLQERSTALEKANQAFREAKEEADQANQAKSEFISRMSHELRTPLNAILGFGQLIEMQNPTEVQRNRINHITRAGHHLLHLINELLDMSRIEAGRLHLSLEPVCLATALNEALDLIRPLAADRSIKISTPIIDPKCYVLADNQRFCQVLLNLVSNAVKYIPLDGKVTISYESLAYSNIRVSITDTGPGIPADKLARLFTPFDRLGKEHSAIEGAGLGLALCKRLMQAMGGTIGADSTPGIGSTFWIELPCAESPLERISRADDADPAKPEQLSLSGKRKILYVEDNLSNLTLVEEILSEEPGVELLSAVDGQLGLDLARTLSPDLILLDLHLPDLPGRQVLFQLRADKRTRDIPVVVISADATQSQIERLMDDGAYAYLTKPLDLTEFFRVVGEASAGSEEKASAS
jgi:signal transduction histidine kinase/ActR/RegA family two-component response regulator